jgi:hypothetical protein
MTGEVAPKLLQDIVAKILCGKCCLNFPVTVAVSCFAPFFLAVLSISRAVPSLRRRETKEL